MYFIRGPPVFSILGNHTGGAASVMLRLGFARALHDDYGAPAYAWLNLTVHPLSPPVTRPRPGSEYEAESAARSAVPPSRRVSMAYGLFEKTATRLPEAAYIGFHPDLAQRPGEWEVGLHEQWTSPHTTIDGASKSLSAIGEGIRLTRTESGQRLTITSTECG